MQAGSSQNIAIEFLNAGGTRAWKDGYYGWRIASWTGPVEQLNDEDTST